MVAIKYIVQLKVQPDPSGGGEGAVSSDANHLGKIRCISCVRHNIDDHLTPLGFKAFQGGLEGEDLLRVDGEVHWEEEEDEVLALQLSVQVKHPDCVAVAVNPDHAVGGEDILGHRHHVVDVQQANAREVGHLVEVRHLRQQFLHLLPLRRLRGD